MERLPSIDKLVNYEGHFSFISNDLLNAQLQPITSFEWWVLCKIIFCSFSFLPGIGTAKNAVTLTERPVSLSPLIGRIKQGSVTAQIPIDQVPLTNPLLASSYESTFANLTPDETEVIANTYGDEVGVQYAESIINFSRSCEYAMFIVDHLVRFCSLSPNTCWPEQSFRNINICW